MSEELELLDFTKGSVTGLLSVLALSIHEGLDRAGRDSLLQSIDRNSKPDQLSMLSSDIDRQGLENLIEILRFGLDAVEAAE